MLTRQTLWDVPVERVADTADEIDLIKRASAGDEAAMLRLFRAYVAVLLEAVNRYKRPLGVEDARQVAFQGLLVAIAEFDPAKGERLAGSLLPTLTRVLARAASTAQAALSVPPRTMQRFHRILAKAGGDVGAGALLAPSYGMPTATFLAVAEAIDMISLEAAMDTNPDLIPFPLDYERAYADASMQKLVAAAFEVLDRRETEVIRLAYGFSDYNPVPDAEIGYRLGLSRMQVFRLRRAALAKMRDALAA